MLKEIPLSSLQMGMFVHKMNGGWFDHPFWKAKFYIDEPQKLRTLQTCSLKSVVIDTSLGKDVDEEAPSSTAGGGTVATGNSRLKSIKRRQSAREKALKPASTAAEMVSAQGLVDNASAKLKDVFRSAHLGRAISVSSVAPIVSDIHASINRNSQAFHGLMRCKLKSEFVYRHSLCVSALMISLARKMNLSTKETIDAGLAGLLLDIGTCYYPKTVNPPLGDFSRLDPEIWHQHVDLGYRALRYDDAVSDWALQACLHHHERIDGRGFPEGLNGADISLGGKMAAICDTFNYLLNNAGERGSLDPAMAVSAMRQMEGAFDPEILRKFIESVGQFPVGSFVKMRSGLLGMVIDENPRQPTRPLVEVFYCLNEGKRIAQRRVKLGDSLDEDEIIDTADLSHLDLPDEEYLREIIFLAAHR